MTITTPVMTSLVIRKVDTVTLILAPVNVTMVSQDLIALLLTIVTMSRAIMMETAPMALVNAIPVSLVFFVMIVRIMHAMEEGHALMGHALASQDIQGYFVRTMILVDHGI